jgi:nitrogen fixation-related uncharacterized protein
METIGMLIGVAVLAGLIFIVIEVINSINK